jgi:hypothetical protein
MTEMLCDWIGAGKAIMGAKANTPAWYEKNKERIILHPKTREWIENSSSQNERSRVKTIRFPRRFGSNRHD